ncbi:MAG: cytochrome c oxidase assembly protein [Terriglobales bacterium]
MAHIQLGMAWSQWAQAGWDLEPSVLIGCALLLLWYAWATRGRPWARLLAFVLGDAGLLFALVSPLDTIADHFNFSAHMTQHLILLDWAAPLLLLGVPRAMAAGWLRHRGVARIERVLRLPLFAWTIGFGTLALWHWPPLYDLAVAHVGVHIVEHLAFLVSSVIFWWPVLSPLRASRMPGWAAGFYLFSRMAVDIVVGSVIALAPVGLYAGYTNARDLRLGGILMWIPSVVLDMGAIPFALAFTSANSSQDGHTVASRFGRGEVAASAGLIAGELAIGKDGGALADQVIAGASGQGLDG